MTEPNIALASTGAALVTLATLTVGPLLGEYVIVLGLGFLGTLIALSEQPTESYKKSIIFLFRGVTFSLIFTGILTTFAIKYLPTDSGLSPYALLGAVSFSIGWTSSRWERIKDWLISLVTKTKEGDGK